MKFNYQFRLCLKFILIEYFLIFSFHQFRFLMVFTCLVLSVFSTIDAYEKDALYILFRMEILVVIWFTMEFFLRYVYNFIRVLTTWIWWICSIWICNHYRLWSSGCRSRYQGCVGRFKFVKRPFCIIGKWNGKKKKI